MSRFLDSRAVYDIQISSRYNDVYEVENLPDTDYGEITAFIEQNNIAIKDDLTFSEYLPQKSDFYQRVKYDFPPLAIALKDYNAVRKMLGYEPIILQTDEFATHWHRAAEEKDIENYIAEHTLLETDAGTLKLSENAVFQEPVGESIYNLYTDVVYIIPDEAAQALLPVQSNRFVMTQSPLPFKTAEALEQLLGRSYPEDPGKDNLPGYSTTVHTTEVNRIIALNFILKASLIYGAIVLMQFLWRYIDDMVGKGLGIPVLAEMFMYAALFLVPMALPLAILLASLMTFGNLGERLELLAMKSAGVSLVHIMRPLIITISIISIGAFFFQNYAMPVVQVKLYTLLWSMRQKSPELDIPEGVFYSEITGFNVYVKHKDTETGLLRDMMIYDYSEGFNKVSVMVADSGRLKTSADKMFLVLSLFNGESFRSLDKQPSTAGTKSSVPYQRETFKSRDILIEFDANFSRTDESFMQNQFMGKNMHDLQIFIDSVSVLLS